MPETSKFVPPETYKEIEGEVPLKTRRESRKINENWKKETSDIISSHRVAIQKKIRIIDNAIMALSAFDPDSGYWGNVSKEDAQKVRTVMEKFGKDSEAYKTLMMMADELDEIKELSSSPQYRNRR
ncbi:MAG: hypothetical protein NTW66_00975 [Candidatus Magasanikbacteria bacterium]|nr:hypothetical protein [Candidatus Magasanikbacteria bacterium]